MIWLFSEIIYYAIIYYWCRMKKKTPVKLDVSLGELYPQALLKNDALREQLYQLLEKSGTDWAWLKEIILAGVAFEIQQNSDVAKDKEFSWVKIPQGDGRRLVPSLAALQALRGEYQSEEIKNKLRIIKSALSVKLDSSNTQKLSQMKYILENFWGILQTLYEYTTKELIAIFTEKIEYTDREINSSLLEFEKMSNVQNLQEKSKKYGSILKVLQEHWWDEREGEEVSKNLQDIVFRKKNEWKKFRKSESFVASDFSNYIKSVVTDEPKQKALLAFLDCFQRYGGSIISTEKGIVNILLVSDKVGSVMRKLCEEWYLKRGNKTPWLQVFGGAIQRKASTQAIVLKSGFSSIPAIENQTLEDIKYFLPEQFLALLCTFAHMLDVKIWNIEEITMTILGKGLATYIDKTSWDAAANIFTLSQFLSKKKSIVPSVISAPKTWDTCSVWIFSKLKLCIHPDKIDKLTMKLQKDSVLVDIGKLLPETQFIVPEPQNRWPLTQLFYDKYCEGMESDIRWPYNIKYYLWKYLFCALVHDTLRQWWYAWSITRPKARESIWVNVAYQDSLYRKKDDKE